MKPRRTLLLNILSNRCPACREGRLFAVRNPFLPKTINTMYVACPNCGADFAREPGFYFGAAYVSYALTVALWVAVLVALYAFGAVGWITFTGFFDQPEMFLTCGTVTLVVMLPLLQRLSRSIWIHMFLRHGDHGSQSEEGRA